MCCFLPWTDVWFIAVQIWDDWLVVGPIDWWSGIRMVRGSHDVLPQLNVRQYSRLARIRASWLASSAVSLVAEDKLDHWDLRPVILILNIASPGLVHRCAEQIWSQFFDGSRRLNPQQRCVFRSCTLIQRTYTENQLVGMSSQMQGDCRLRPIWPVPYKSWRETKLNEYLWMSVWFPAAAVTKETNLLFDFYWHQQALKIQSCSVLAAPF